MAEPPRAPQPLAVPLHLSYFHHHLLPGNDAVDYPKIIVATADITKAVEEDIRACDGICTLLCMHGPERLDVFLKNIRSYEVHLEYTVYPHNPNMDAFTMMSFGKHVMAAFFRPTASNRGKNVNVFHDETLRKVVWGYWHILPSGRWHMVSGGAGLSTRPTRSADLSDISWAIGIGIWLKSATYLGQRGDSNQSNTRHYPFGPGMNGLRPFEPICPKTWVVPDQCFRVEEVNDEPCV